MKNLSKFISELYYVDSIIYHSKIIELFMSNTKRIDKFNFQCPSCDIFINLDSTNTLTIDWCGDIYRAKDKQSISCLLLVSMRGTLRELMEMGKHKTITSMHVVFTHVRIDESTYVSDLHTINLIPYADTISAVVNRTAT